MLGLNKNIETLLGWFKCQMRDTTLVKLSLEIISSRILCICIEENRKLLFYIKVKLLNWFKTIFLGGYLYRPKRNSPLKIFLWTYYFVCCATYGYICLFLILQESYHFGNNILMTPLPLWRRNCLENSKKSFHIFRLK